MLTLRNNLGRTALRLPGPQRRLQEITGALALGHSVYWAYPQTIDPTNIVARITDLCAGSGFTIRELRLEPDMIEPKIAVANLIRAGNKADAFGQSDTHNYIRRLMEHTPHVIVLSDIQRLTPEGIKAWSRFISLWVSQAKHMSADDSDPTALFIPTASWQFGDLLDPDPFLEKMAYWDWLGEPEMLILAREMAYDRSLDMLARLWVEASFVGLVGDDVRLLQWLIDDFEMCHCPRSIMQRLSDYATQMQWHHMLGETPQLSVRMQDVVGKAEHSIAATTDGPPIASRDLWSIGWYSTDDYVATSVHASILALQDNQALIEHRIWRGQARVLLPILDARRLELCRFLSRRYSAWKSYRYGDHGPHFIHSNPVVLDDNTRLDEYPAILAFVDGLRRKRSTAELRALYNAVKTMRDTRNALAHYTPLTRAQFDHFWAAVDSIHKIAQATG